MPGRDRGWVSVEIEGEKWWSPLRYGKYFRVRFTIEGVAVLFGGYTDYVSDLHMEEAFQFVTYIQCYSDIDPADINPMFYVTSILETANDAWRNSRVPVTPFLHVILNSKKPSKLESLAVWKCREFKLEALARAIESGCLPLLKFLRVDGATGHLALAKVMEAGNLSLLEELSLVGCEMSSIGCQAYAAAMGLGKLPSLASIDFSKNPDIGKKGVEALAHAIQSGELKNLAVLSLKSCAIDDDGLITIADLFRGAFGSVVHNFSVLDFTDNLFTDVGLLSLADVLQTGRLNSLELLSLFGCKNASQAGVSALVSALSFNMCLNVEVLLEWEKFPDLQRRKEQFMERNSRYRDILAGLEGWPVVPATFGKIYLCGNPEVGKTTLRQNLQRGLLKSLLTWERRPHVENRTRGIDVSKFSKKGRFYRSEIPITLLVWDMAGQRDYHLIHNAFFPDLGSVEGKATTFVVVYSSKSTIEESEQQLDYWLRFIASSCGKAPHNLRHVMVVLNRINGDPEAKRQAPKWKQALESLREKFRDYLDIRTDPFIVDVRRRRHVNGLKSCLLEHSIHLLRDRMVPEICQFLEKNVIVWSQARRQFPVLRWTDFAAQVRETSREPWRDEDLEAATKYLNEAGVLIYLDEEICSRWKLVVVDPNWFCRDIVGNMFRLEYHDMVDPAEHLFRRQLDKSTGSISIQKFKEFCRSLKSKGWTSSQIEDLIAILLWLGLCYHGRDENIFIPSLIAEIGTPGHNWGPPQAQDNRFNDYSEDQWVMGFCVEHHKDELTLAPITLWHRFQVELAQMVRFNGHPDNDFVCGRYFMTFSVDEMAVLIEVTTNQGSPTFGNISIFVKPLHAEDNLGGSHSKQSQVDLASDLVEILLMLWNKVCPGVEYLHKVIWPWPASWSGPHIMPERNVDVEEVKKWVQECNFGRRMQWRVGSTGSITEDQLLSSKDKDGVVRSGQRSLHIVRQVLEEAVELRIYPSDVLSGEGLREESTMASDEEVPLPRSPTGKLLFKTYMKLNEMDKKLDNLGELSREILKNQKTLRQKLKDVGDVFLQDKERSCPRFIYFGKKDSGAWVTFKEALSPSVSARLHFACEARYDDYGQHAVTDQRGLEVSTLKKWAATIAPWLKVSLTALYISSKIAANVLAPGLGLILPNFEEWQQASSLSQGLALGTGFSREALNQHMIEGMGLDAYEANWDPRELYGKSRAAVSDLLGKMTAETYEKKLGLRKVCLYYGDGSLHGIVWICNACFEKYRRSNISMTELY